MLLEDLDLLDAEIRSETPQEAVGLALWTSREQASVGDDSWLAIHMPQDYRNAAAQLKASADNLNLTAQNEPGWKAIYATALSLWKEYHDIGFVSSLTLTDATWNAIADAQRRVDEFAAQMRAQKKPVVEPPHTPIDNRVLGDKPSELLAWLKKYAPWLIGTVVVLGAGSVVVPIVAPLLAARSLARRDIP